MSGAAVAGPRRPAIDRDAAMRLAETEYERFVTQVRELAPEDWHRPTACPDWDVHAMCCHVLGMVEFAASPDESQRQTGRARERGGIFIDSLTALQVEEHLHLSPAALIEQFAQAVPRAVRGRRLAPEQVRDLRLEGQPFPTRGEKTESWTLAYLHDVIFTRDLWIHRSDIALATQREMVLTSDHDAVLVADVAVEWAQRHGQACTLTLSGPAGGRWSFEGEGESADGYELDAVEFCRILSGRGAGDGLLTTRVPF
jgi:uncharacterized protein (TIGR03083 family)